MKLGFWHFPAKIVVAVFIIIAASGLAMAAASSPLSDSKKSAATAGEIPVSIVSVNPPDNGVSRIASDKLGFILSLHLAAGRSYKGAFNLRNIADEDIIIGVTADKPDYVLIDFVDPVYGVSGQAGWQQWRLYLRKDSISTISYSIQSGTAVVPGSYEIKVSLITEEFSLLRFTPVPAGKRMWGGDVPATSPPIVGHAWPMFRHNAQHTGRSSYPGLTFEVFTVGGVLISSSPAIAADGTVYVGSDNNKLYALNPDGSLKWPFITGNDIGSSPAIAADGTVYFGSNDDNLYALNPDGSFKWNFTATNDVVSSPAIAADGTIYFGSYDQKLYALKPDGSLKWSYGTGGVVFSSPAVAADGTVYVGSLDKKFYALNPNGTLKWSYTTGGVVFSSPAIAADGTVYFGSNDNKLYALNPDGSLKWSFTQAGNDIVSSPAIAADGTIHFGSNDNKLYALNPDGSLNWVFTPAGFVFASPAIAADGTVIYVKGGAGGGW